jgi:hypothetical protein
MRYGILPLSSELATMLALPIILILFAVRTKRKVSFSAAILLAAMAFSIATFGDSERIILTIGCAAGSLLVSIVGMRLGRKAINLRVELDRISVRLTELERAESRRLLEKVRSQDSKLNPQLEAGELTKTEGDLRGALLDTERGAITKIY